MRNPVREPTTTPTAVHTRPVPSQWSSSSPTPPQTITPPSSEPRVGPAHGDGDSVYGTWVRVTTRASSTRVPMVPTSKETNSTGRE